MIDSPEISGACVPTNCPCRKILDAFDGSTIRAR